MYRTNWTVERDDNHNEWLVIRYTDVAKIVARFDDRAAAVAYRDKMKAKKGDHDGLHVQRKLRCG